MKKSVLLLLTVLLSANLFAQGFESSKLRAGAGLVYATDINSLGLAFNGVYSFTEQWEGAVGFTHIFEKDYMSYNVLDLDAHYVFFDNGAGMNVYGLGGLSFNFWKFNWPDEYAELGLGSESGSDVGLNLGVGMNYALSDVLNLAPEFRVTMADGSYVRIGATLQYRF